MLQSCETDPGTGESDEAHRQVYGGEHEAKFSHELIAGAASFAGMKAWEDHQRKEGKCFRDATLNCVCNVLKRFNRQGRQARLC